ncbi:hypothetical protein HanPSC8_Chr14g0626811 [Helianthus annuus]|nr:hypothetical protein HanPSC8_Chr14g0626811 [Helianthus annuus]
MPKCLTHKTRLIIYFKVSNYQLALIPATSMSVLRSSMVQSMVCTFAITAEVTSLAWRYRSSSSK